MSVENQNVSPPKLFVSYSWTDQPHMDWVMQLATDLRQYGVETIIDRWHLKEGQDAHSFMEQMVRANEINKVALVCDSKYVERANKREGGVGAESQIITSNIFGDVQQTKFVAVAVESDEGGKALLPNFMLSRIYVDFRNRDSYSESLQQLVRWAYDKPLYVEPEVGPPPRFLDERVNFPPIEIRVDQRLATDPSNGGFVEFFEEVSERYADFEVHMKNDEPNDETVFQSILSLAPIISQVVSTLKVRLMIGELSDIESDAVIAYFEKIYANYEKGATRWSADVTKFYGQFLYPALLAQMIKYRRFKAAGDIVNGKLLKRSYGGVTAEAVAIHSLSFNLESLEGRRNRLSLNRASLHADIIKQMCDLIKMDFTDFMQAEFVIFLFTSHIGENISWWPDSNIYASDSHGSFPWFARAVNSPYREQLMGLVGLDNREEIESFVQRVKSGDISQVRWRSAFSTLPTLQLANFENIIGSY